MTNKSSWIDGGVAVRTDLRVATSLYAD